MSGLRSRNKGKRGEREVAELLRSFGVEARRSQQFSGQDQTADLTTSVNGVHFEVKRYARIGAARFLEQAKRDAGDAVPVVAMREDRGEWMLMIPMDQLMELIQRIGEAIPTPNGTSD